MTHTIQVWYIYLHIWLMFMGNVGKYNIQYMDPMGNDIHFGARHHFQHHEMQWNNLGKLKGTRQNCTRFSFFYALPFF